jgi:hypothetical protein
MAVNQFLIVIVLLTAIALLALILQLRRPPQHLRRAADG